MNPTAHTSAPLDDPIVHRINGFPGRYAIQFGHYFSIHTTAEQWDAYDRQIRALIGVLENAVEAAAT